MQIPSEGQEHVHEDSSHTIKSQEISQSKKSKDE